MSNIDSAVMDHFEDHAKLKEEKVLGSDPFKLHSEADVRLTIPSIKPKPTEAASHGELAQKGTYLGPKTPTPNQENIDVMCDTKTSSAFMSFSLPSVHCYDSPPNGSILAVEVDTSGNGSPKTPTRVFDPFAPGPEELELAPICKKVVKITRNFTPRRLKFDELDECLENRNEACAIETISEEMLLESVYTSLLEAVVRKQTEEWLAEKKPSCTPTAKTPPVQKLTGVAETCPAAPIKMTTSKTSNIDMVRRKLEF